MKQVQSFENLSIYEHIKKSEEHKSQILFFKSKKS